MLKKWLEQQRQFREQAARDAMRIMLRNSFGGPTVMLHEVRQATTLTANDRQVLRGYST